MLPIARFTNSSRSKKMTSGRGREVDTPVTALVCAVVVMKCLKIALVGGKASSNYIATLSRVGDFRADTQAGSSDPSACPRVPLRQGCGSTSGGQLPIRPTHEGCPM